MSLHLNRRAVLKLTAGAATAAALGLPNTSQGQIMQTNNGADGGYIELARTPDAVSIATADGGLVTATSSGNGRFAAAGVEVITEAKGGVLQVRLSAPKAAVKQIRLRWRGSTAPWRQVMGDHWERTYGDLAWRPATSIRPAPWYFLASTAADATHAFGVRTQPNGFCFFQHDADAITLTCDVRSGGVGVELGDRTLTVCDIISRRGQSGESSFGAQVAFCKAMCSKPRMTPHQVYGFNDWYYAYGHNTQAGLLADADTLADLTAGLANRPYCVVDMGWEVQSKMPKGQWSAPRPAFGPMDEFAAQMKAKSTRPGIWVRPLTDEFGAWPTNLHFKHQPKFLDPSLPGTKDIVTADIQRLVSWGYELIKHDFSTFDILADWGKDMHDGEVTRDGWSFARRNQTTAEVINDLYKTIRDAAGDTVIIGCNTVSHLAAGVFELNRIGDDTSGREWERTVQMGVNTLAFRAAHEGTFYGADADCAPITEKIEWRRNKQWLDLAAKSGTPLFVSLDRKAANPEILASLKSALAVASERVPVSEPLDWKETHRPRKWKLDGVETTYDWS